MRPIAPLFVALVASCALLPKVAYQPYEGNANFYGSAGGTKLVVDGIDIWTYGTPPRPFSVLGIATIETQNGDNDDVGRSAVAGRIKAIGGIAAIQVTGNRSFSGVLRIAPDAPLPAGVRRTKFAIINYASENQ